MNVHQRRMLRLTLPLPLACLACAPPSIPAESPYSVPLTLRLVGDSVWEASFGSADNEARFRVRPRLKPISDSTGFTFTSWTLFPVKGSKPRAFLAALAKAHNTADTVTMPPPADSLHLTVALLGLNTARNRGGAFGANNTGNWIPAKLFLAGGEGEIYLNLNPVEGRAELSVKDEEYGPIVLRELARILSRH